MNVRKKIYYFIAGVLAALLACLFRGLYKTPGRDNDGAGNSDGLITRADEIKRKSKELDKRSIEALERARRAIKKSRDFIAENEATKKRGY